LFTLSAEKAALFVPRRALTCIKANRSHLTQVSYSRAAQQSPRHTIEARVSSPNTGGIFAVQNHFMNKYMILNVTAVKTLI
jgi:hypothetical protein